MRSVPLTLKVVQIGNSRGVRLPKGLLARHRIGDSVSVRSTEGGILLTPSKDKRLGWVETFKFMAAAKDDRFSDMDVTVADGLEDGL
jgi:antitoxin MazE